MADSCATCRHDGRSSCRGGQTCPCQYYSPKWKRDYPLKDAKAETEPKKYNFVKQTPEKLAENWAYAHADGNCPKENNCPENKAQDIAGCFKCAWLAGAKYGIRTSILRVRKLTWVVNQIGIWYNRNQKNPYPDMQKLYELIETAQSP